MQTRSVQASFPPSSSSVHTLDFGTMPLLSVQAVPQFSHSCPKASQKSSRSTDSRAPPQILCECPFQLWVTLTHLPRQRQSLQAGSSCYFKEKISRRKKGLLMSSSTILKSCIISPYFVFAHRTPKLQFKCDSSLKQLQIFMWWHWLIQGGSRFVKEW